MISEKICILKYTFVIFFSEDSHDNENSNDLNLSTSGKIKFSVLYENF